MVPKSGCRQHLNGPLKFQPGASAIRCASRMASGNTCRG
ncbi:MAG: hypothetical protein EHM42_11500 [Planctomycetaceae bacterium]|nr:MAG: hypothetical protein EHM42_12600 [Planctomycetaceae bacterium]RPI80887.1 MAG: hypothetical protein EHM42_11500 [Planctomycetaceae bacterium]